MSRLTVLALVAALASTAGVPTYAAALQIKTQAPAYYRMMLGEFEITVLSDGMVDLPMDKLLSAAKPGQVLRSLKKPYLTSSVETSVNGYLVNTESKLMLIDTGAARLFGPTLGRLLGNLKAAGYSAEQVDEIYITHMHPDHVGGLLSESKPAFPNAVVRVDQRDADFWLSVDNMAKAPADGKGFFEDVMISIKSYQDAGRFQPFTGDTLMLPGIRAIAAPGHTPGHTFSVIESQGQKLFVWSDLMHAAAVQLSDPAVTIAFDSDSTAAAPLRKKAFAGAAKTAISLPWPMWLSPASAACAAKVRAMRGYP